MSEKIDIEQVDGIGALESLTTTDKSNLVNAINEVKGSVPNVTGLVPYTGANQPINLNTQDFTTGGYTNRLHSYFERINLASNSTDTALGNFKLLTNVAAAGMGNATGSEGDIVISLPITTTTHWQAEIDILLASYRTTLNVGGYGTTNLNRFVNVVYGSIDDITEVKFGRIGDNTVIIIKRANSTIHRLQVNISKFYYHHSNSVDLYNDKTKYKVEYIDEADLVGFTLNGTITNAQFTRDSYLWNKGSFSQTDINNWNTAYSWGDYRQYGLGVDASVNFAPNGGSNIKSGLFGSNSSASGTPLPGSSGGYIHLRSATSGNQYWSQLWLLGNATTTPRAFISHGNGTTRNADWVELYHSGNFNPAQYVLQSDFNTQLANYVPINGVTTINNTKTFTSSPIVPNGTLNGHAVNKSQLDAVAASIPTNNSQLTNDAGYITSSALSGYVPTSRTITINGTAYDLSENRSWTIPNTTYTGSTSVILSGNSFQRAALTGDVTASQNSNTTTIANNAVTNPKMALMNANSIKGRAGSIGNPQDLTPAQVRTMLNVQEGANRTRIGINGGNYTEVGDINLEAGTGIELTKTSSNTVQIDCTVSPEYMFSKIIMENDYSDHETFIHEFNKLYLFLNNSLNFTEITIDPVSSLVDGSEIIIMSEYSGTPGYETVRINGPFVDAYGTQTSYVTISRGKWHRYTWFAELGRFMTSGYGTM